MIDAALSAFREALGEDHVRNDSPTLARYGSSTMPIERRIAGVLRPSGVEDVQRIVQIAARHGVALYPISTGHNWGYGSAQPARNDNVIVDLGRMNRIVELDTELAYVVVEPGVTQRQLYEHLRERGARMWLNPTGAGPECSILGNTLERGFGIGPNGDHFLAQCGMEVVMGNGDVLRTGFGHYTGARSTYVYKWGVGPYLDGLFTQSSYGIVTKMGVWLTPEPEAFEACYFMCMADSQLGPLLQELRRLLFAGVFRGPINLLHRNRVLIMLDRYPWDEMGGRTPLSEEVAARRAADKKIGCWNGVGSIYGTREQVRAARQAISRALRGKVDRLQFLSESKLALLRRFPGALGAVMRMNVRDLLRTLENSYGMMKGIPSEVALSLAYWRNRRPMPAPGAMNPDRDNCGLMWFAPIIPITERDVSAFRAVVEPIFARHGFEACITFTAVNERCFDCTLPLLFDKENPAEVANAQACYRELVEECRKAGYYAYRLGLQTMDEETARDDVFWDVANKVKAALDPNGLISPGRYVR